VEKVATAAMSIGFIISSLSWNNADRPVKNLSSVAFLQANLAFACPTRLSMVKNIIGRGSVSILYARGACPNDWPNRRSGRAVMTLNIAMIAN
jgi:hypothetical protein